ncbi:ABC-F family ATP-binding cassette domain-containing protein [Luteibacter pinisoli]|uniref:ABC-F family ATP-binding cassette domain-containing protein n=1 Tax=Luteibacter pinisoli TaxID=2589080 RepID=A0A4Y5ZBA1_9GAMM|nr:ATP-binding cassette domain-containing protein [Luteibacter pinisoli]QDE41328.1 ABC-F family ATP-binding cassette domain-containing protein [Luteibacter pinisoli]
MTASLLTLESVSFVLPDGRVLFRDLFETLDDRPTGLAGGNGVGKSVLGQLLAGALLPSSGRCQRSVNVHYLAQQVGAGDGTVASLAGVDHVLAALSRIEQGSVDAADFDAVGTRWDMRARLTDALTDAGLAHLTADIPATRLSGGEAMRVALLGARLADAGYLILDEPTNHLDADNRAALMAWLATWRGGLLVISHDRALLDTMTRTLELSERGLRSYGGGYAFYAEQKAHEREATQRELDSARAERRRGEQALREQNENHARRSARGDRAGKTANLPPILLGRRKERSEVTSGKLREQQASTRAQLNERVGEAASAVMRDTTVVLRAPDGPASQGRVARLGQVTLPWGPEALRAVDLTVYGAQRIGITGPNGSGKSTLLKVLAGEIAPAAGNVEVFVPFARLDQRLDQLNPTQTVLEQLANAAPGLREGELRTRLALLGLDTATVTTPSAHLSGGERLKAALALAILATPPARLLLLDEPTNHLDLPSVQAVEAMLREYTGALIVVSHDVAFLDALGLTHRYWASAEGWRTEPW